MLVYSRSIHSHVSLCVRVCITCQNNSVKCVRDQRMEQTKTQCEMCMCVCLTNKKGKNAKFLI